MEDNRLHLSELQNKILYIISTDYRVGYKTLINKIKRARATILPSVESLIRRNYITKQKINPEYEKSKVIFKPTPLGIDYALSKLGVDVKDVMID